MVDASQAAEPVERVLGCQSIEDRVDLPFSIQKGDEECDAYAAFKSGSVEFATLVSSRQLRRRPFLRWVFDLRRRLAPPHWSPLERSQRNFIEMTSWRVADGASKNLWCSDPGAKSVRLALDAWEKIQKHGRT